MQLAAQKRHKSWSRGRGLKFCSVLYVVKRHQHSGYVHICNLAPIRPTARALDGGQAFLGLCTCGMEERAFKCGEVNRVPQQQKQHQLKYYPAHVYHDDTGQSWRRVPVDGQNGKTETEKGERLR